MKRTCCGVVLTYALGLVCAAQSSRSEFEQRFRDAVWATNDNINVDAPDHALPKEEQLLAMARQAGVSQFEMQSLLLKMVDEGINTHAEDEAWKKRGMAKSALSVLADLADATAIDRLLQIADQAPSALRTAALGSVIRVANREASEKLPAVMNRLVDGHEFSHAYAFLRKDMRAYPGNSPDDNRRKTLLVQIFKDGLRNPAYEDRIYLDSVIEEYDPVFRGSEERQRILQELSGSNNPNIKKYADLKLQEYFIKMEGQAPAGKAERTGPVVAPSDAKSPATTSEAKLVPTIESRALWPLSLGVIMALLAGVVIWLRRR